MSRRQTTAGRPRIAGGEVDSEAPASFCPLPSAVCPLLLHVGGTRHVRHTPFRHAFAYRMWMVSVDLDRIDTARMPLFAHNRWAPLSLADRDHGARDGSALRPWIAAQLAASGLGDYAATIRFLFIPRLFGWAFNPIAFFFCYDAGGRLGAVLHQVKNTFGDQHSYLIAVAQDAGVIHQAAPKLLHVSPFFDRSGGYRFAFRAPGFTPGGRFDLSINYGAQDAPRLTATLHLATRAATLKSVLTLLIQQPLMPVKVVIAIHWQALRLWLRGAAYHAVPAAPAAAVSLGSQ